MYIFIVSERGERTNICSNFRIFDIFGFVEYLKSKKEQSWRVQYRVAKINDDSFTTRIFKYLSIEEFEEIFSDKLTDIKCLLDYEKNRWGIDYPYFKKDIHVKHGTMIERN